MTEISHERCSELLRPFLYDELSEPEAASVRSHLAACSDCSQERDAIAALLAPDDDRLSELESARIRARVRAAVAPPARTTPSRTYRFAQAMGAAALLIGGAVLAYTAVTGNFGGGGPDMGAAGRAADEATARIVEGLPVQIPAPAAAPAKAQARRNKRGNADAAGGVAGQTTGEDATFEQLEGADEEAAVKPQPKPIYAIDVPAVTERDLTTVGRFGTSLLRFARVYNAADAENLQIEFLQLLANATGSEGKADQITECGLTVLGRPYPTLPAIGFYTERSEQEILVLAFAWADDPDGRLDRFMVWSWRDGDCGSVPDYRSGRIKS
jgi:Putative zinc-finger